MQITTCLLVLCNQSGAESCQSVSSLSAYEHLYFDLELFESDLPLQFLSYLVYLVVDLNQAFIGCGLSWKLKISLTKVKRKRTINITKLNLLAQMIFLVFANFYLHHDLDFCRAFLKNCQICLLDFHRTKNQMDFCIKIWLN